jgi:hypothetical protein
MEADIASVPDHDPLRQVGTSACGLLREAETNDWVGWFPCPSASGQRLHQADIAVGTAHDPTQALRASAPERSNLTVTDGRDGKVDDLFSALPPRTTYAPSHPEGFRYFYLDERCIGFEAQKDTARRHE